MKQFKTRYSYEAAETVSGRGEDIAAAIYKRFGQGEHIISTGSGERYLITAIEADTHTVHARPTDSGEFPHITIENKQERIKPSEIKTATFYKKK